MKKIIPSAEVVEVIEVAWIASYHSATTQRTYATELTLFKDWLQRMGPIGLLSVEGVHASAYFHYIDKKAPGGNTGRKELRKAGAAKGRGLGSATVNKKIAALRSFYTYAISGGHYRGVNPFGKAFVKAPKSSSDRRRERRALKSEEVRSLFESQDHRTLIGRRNRAILAGLFYGGLRVSELLSLRVDSLRFTEEGTAFLAIPTTKGGGDERVAISNKAKALIEAWLTWRVKLSGKSKEMCAAEPLIVSISRHGTLGTTLSTSGVRRALGRMAAAAGVEPFSTHTGRRTAITELLKAGKSHREVRRFSRHASVTMVEGYDLEEEGMDSNVGRELSY